MKCCEKLERSFAHLYESGGMRRLHLRRHANILKRLLVHAAAFNLGLVMRQKWGRGTPRGLQGRRLELFLALLGQLASLWPLCLGSESCDLGPELTRELFEPANDALLANAKRADSATGC